MIVTDIRYYHKKIEFLLRADLNVERYYTHIITKQVKQSGYPIEVLLKTAAET